MNNQLLDIKLRWTQTQPEADTLAAALLINRRAGVIRVCVITAVNPAHGASLAAFINVLSECKRRAAGFTICKDSSEQ